MHICSQIESNKAAKSVVAQTWKSVPVSFCHREQHTAAAADRSEADQAGSLNGAAAEDDSPFAVSAVDGEGNESPDAASAAVVYAGGDKGNVFSGNHRSAQSAEQQPARAVSTRSSLRRAHRSRRLGSSYAASAHRSKSSTAAAVPADALQQQQHATMYDTLASVECAKIEAQLQAEVAGCDKRLEQCRTARRKHRLAHRAVSKCPSGNGGAEHQDDSSHRSKAQLQKSALKVAIEAELADGSGSRFEVQQVGSWPCRWRPPQPCALSNFSAVVCQVLALVHRFTAYRALHKMPCCHEAMESRTCN